MAQCLLLSTEFPRWLVNKLVFFFFFFGGGGGGWTWCESVEVYWVGKSLPIW